MGDVEGFRYDPEPPPCGTITDVRPARPRVGDIKKLTVRHTRTTIGLSVHLRAMPKLNRSSLSFQVRTPDRAFVVAVFRTGGDDQARVYGERPPPSPPLGQECYSWIDDVSVRACRGAVAEQDRATDIATVSLPRRCLGKPKWIRVSAEVGRSKGGAFYADAWAPRGSKPSGPWGHVYSPRVRATR